jgi:hypothetical protein
MIQAERQEESLGPDRPGCASAVGSDFIGSLPQMPNGLLKFYFLRISTLC